jgi:hypothetical protein
MRQSAGFGLAPLALLLVALLPSSCASSHPCPGASLDLRTGARSLGASSGSTGVRVGEAVTVVGRRFDRSCADSEGATATGEGASRLGVRLFVVQGRTRISVAQVDATSGGFTVQIGVPAGLIAGRAEVRAQRGLEADEPPLARSEFVVSAG